MFAERLPVGISRSASNLDQETKRAGFKCLPCTAVACLWREIHLLRYAFALGSGIGTQRDPGIELMSAGIVRECRRAQDMRDARVKGIQRRCGTTAISIRKIVRQQGPACTCGWIRHCQSHRFEGYCTGIARLEVHPPAQLRTAFQPAIGYCKSRGKCAGNRGRGRGRL